MIACVSLSETELDFSRCVAASSGARVVEGPLPAAPLSAKGELLFLASARASDIQQVLEWMRPLVVMIPEAMDADEILAAGAAAVYPVSASVNVMPALALASRGPVSFVISDNPLLRSMARQILRFAGRIPRMDFSSADDTVTVLGAIDEWPELILLDLDSTRVDSLAFFHGLEKVLRNRPHDRARCQILVCKDFAKPGLDILRMRPVLSGHAKKIFHPEGALLALLESMIFFPGPEVEAPPAARNLRELLYGEDLSEPGRSPAVILKAAGSDVMRKSVLFLRAAAFLAREKSAQVAMRAG